ncbi:MAG: hypothetical protein ABW318_23075 [Vicinamibacterales bacterium]
MDAHDMVIIIGTGARGGTLARRLAPSGKCVRHCRIGTDPVTPALNTGWRAPFDTFYIVNTSVLPSIGAANPALTAMADALRVGKHADATGLTRGAR